MKRSVQYSYVQSNFGWYLDLQGKYEEEEAMHRRALDAREKMLRLSILTRSPVSTTLV